MFSTTITQKNFIYCRFSKVLRHFNNFIGILSEFQRHLIVVTLVVHQSLNYVLISTQK